MSKGRQILSTRALIRVLDALVVNGIWADAMKTVGGAERTALEWRARCLHDMKANDLSSVFWLEYREQFDWWVNHVGRVRQENKILGEATMRTQAFNGIEEKIFTPDGRPVWKEDEKYLHRSDDYIRQAEGLGDWEDVTWFRYAHTPDGKPVQATRVVQIPAQLRRSVLAASHPDYRESLDVNVEHSGTVQVVSPIAKLASEPRKDVAELRRILAMSPEERRALLGASKYPKNASGTVMNANTGAPRGNDNMPDHELDRRAALPPPKPPTPQPSYAKRKPSNSLDRGEGIGRGEPPPGGMKVA